MQNISKLEILNLFNWKKRPEIQNLKPQEDSFVINNLIYIPEQLGISQSQFARMIGISRDMYHNYVSGRSGVPLDVLERITNLVDGISLNDLRLIDISKEHRVITLIIKSKNVPQSDDLLVNELKEIIEQQRILIDLLTRQKLQK